MVFCGPDSRPYFATCNKILVRYVGIVESCSTAILNVLKIDSRSYVVCVDAVEATVKTARCNRKFSSTSMKVMLCIMF